MAKQHDRTSELGRQLRYDHEPAIAAIVATGRALGCSITRTAHALQISRRTLHRWIAQHRLLGVAWAGLRDDLVGATDSPSDSAHV